MKNAQKFSFKEMLSLRTRTIVLQKHSKLSKNRLGSLGVFMMKRKPSHTAQRIFWCRTQQKSASLLISTVLIVQKLLGLYVFKERVKKGYT